MLFLIKSLEADIGLHCWENYLKFKYKINKLIILNCLVEE
jgi:hypothetical protein